jgi:hypothetical protein
MLNAHRTILVVDKEVVGILVAVEKRNLSAEHL